MLDNVTWSIAWRYWRAKNSNRFASFITLSSVIGITLGIAALIIITSVMNGLEGRLKQKILDVIPQMTITSVDGIKKSELENLNIDELQGYTPLVSSQAMLQAGDKITGALVYGIEPSQEDKLSPIAKYTNQQSLDSLTPRSYNIILGADIARILGVNIGDKIRVFSGEGVTYSPLGPIPSQRTFTISDIFVSGSSVDESFAYINFEDGQRLVKQQPLGTVQEYRLYFKDPFTIDNFSNLIKSKFLHATVSDWRQSYGDYFTAVKMEKNMMSLLLSLILFVAAFNIIASLVMMVIDKTPDIAILKTFGLSNKEVQKIFVLQGILNAVLGIILGLILGLVITLGINPILNFLNVSILNSRDSLPVLINIKSILILILGTLLLTFIATLYPARRATKIEPAEALSYE